MRSFENSLFSESFEGNWISYQKNPAHLRLAKSLDNDCKKVPVFYSSPTWTNIKPVDYRIRYFMNASIRYHKNPSLWKSFHNDSRKFLQKSWNKFQCFKVLLTRTNANCVGLRICYPGNSVSYHKNPAPTSLRPCEISRPSKKVSTCSLVLAWNDYLSRVSPLDS